MPKVSVVIPCYNLGQYLDDAVGSVLGQDFADFEIIVVDDGSDDPQTCRLLDDYCRPKTTLIRIPHQGVAVARNTGIAAAGGDYILPLDADDMIEPDFLGRAVAILGMDAETAIVACDALLIGERQGVRPLQNFSRERLLVENLLYATSLFRKSDWAAVGGYWPAMKYGWEDWEFWIALTRRRPKVAKIPEALLRYRIRSDSRDRSISLVCKARMLLLIVGRHLGSYLRSPVSLAGLLANAACRAGRRGA